MRAGYLISSFLAKVFLLLACSTFVLGNETPTTNSYLTDADRVRLKQVFTSAWSLKDLPSVHYAILGHKLLSEPVPNPKDVCKFLADSLGATSTPETYYHVAVAWKNIGNCPGALPNKEITEKLSGVLDKEGVSIQDVFYAVLGLKSLGGAVAAPAKVAKSLQVALKKDDSVSNLGYVFHVASELGPAGSFAFDRMEDALVQADEVDGKYLQFEGGLTITSLVVSGVYKLSVALDKAPPLSGDQAVRFANYFLSRRSVQTPRGAHSLLAALTAVADNKFQTVVVVVALGGGLVGEGGEVRVRVSDALGRPLPGPLSVTLESAARAKDSVVVVSKLKFKQDAASTDKCVYSVGVMDRNPEAGVYKAVVSVSGGGGRLVGGVGVTLPLTVPAQPVVEPFQIGVADTDQTTTPKLHTVKYPGKLGSSLELDSQQKLLVRFTVKDKRTGRSLTAHQAFLRLTHGETNQEVIFLAQPDQANNYKLDLDIGSKGGDLGWASGGYRVDLVIGDVALSPSLSWTVGELILRLPSDPPPAHSPSDSLYAPKPEIKHLFREPEKRPPVFVSNLFTALALVPLLVLLGLWLKLGINISNFPFSLSAVGFHLGLAAIFCLFGLFWLKLNMFETLKYLLGLGVVTFLCGNQMLAKIAANRKH